LKITIHRGTQEIGGSCIELSVGKTRVILDLGMPLFQPRNKKETLDQATLRNSTTSDLLKSGVLPGVKGLYKGSGGPSVTAVLLSHPHQDHYGLLGHIKPDVPVYLSDGAKRLIEVSDIFLPLKVRLQKTVRIDDRKPVRIGDMTLTPYLVDHSAFAAMAFLIEGGGKKVFYSGDFRGHGRKWKLFDTFCRRPPKGIDCLLMEGTTLGRPKAKVITETDVEEQILNLGRKHKGLKLLYGSAQNIDRVVSFYRAARRMNGLLVIDLYTAYALESLEVRSIPHPTGGFRNLRVFYTKHLMRTIARKGMSALFKKFRPYEIRSADIAKNPSRIFMMYRPALEEEIEGIGPIQDSVLIYSLWEGYKKKNSFRSVETFLKRNRIALESAHTSGHAGFDDLKRLVTALKPKVLVPIHTFQPRRYTEMWPSVEIVKDGISCEVGGVSRVRRIRS